MIPQEVFNYFYDNHKISLLESEYEDIKNVVIPPFNEVKSYVEKQSGYMLGKDEARLLSLAYIFIRGEEI